MDVKKVGKAGVGCLLVVIGLLLIISGLFWWYFVGQTWRFLSEHVFDKSIGAIIVLLGAACLYAAFKLVDTRDQEPPKKKPDA